MVGSSSSLSSSCASFGSFEDILIKACSTVKFSCSYGGRILPRYPDRKLRYIGGEIRILSVDRSIPFLDLQGKMGELCGWDAVNVRCQLPTDDLDALVTITSDEDLAYLIEEYDLANRDRQFPLKVRAFLHQTPMKSPKSANPAPVKDKAPLYNHAHAMPERCIYHITSSPGFSVLSTNVSGRFRLHGHHAQEIPPVPHHHHIHHGIYRQ